jgi:hypothetical protein
VLLAAAVPTTATGDWADASVIMLVIVVNTSMGVVRPVEQPAAGREIRGSGAGTVNVDPPDPAGDQEARIKCVADAGAGSPRNSSTGVPCG